MPVLNKNLVHFNNRLMDHKAWTPDIPQLEKYQNHILFVYDGMMQSYLRHQVIAMNGAKYIGKYQTVDMHFIMMLYRNGVKDNYPVVLREKSKHARSIYGEAFSVNPHTIMVIDKLNKNRVYSERVRQEIMAVGDESRTKHYAWMYIGKADYWESEITNKEQSFKPAMTQTFKRTGSSFYRFFPNDQSRELYPKYSDHPVG